MFHTWWLRNVKQRMYMSKQQTQWHRSSEQRWHYGSTAAQRLLVWKELCKREVITRTSQKSFKFSFTMFKKLTITSRESDHVAEVLWPFFPLPSTLKRPPLINHVQPQLRQIFLLCWDGEPRQHSAGEPLAKLSSCIWFRCSPICDCGRAAVIADL